MFPIVHEKFAISACGANGGTMFIRLIVAAAFFLISTISGAFAADLPEEQTVYPPPSMIWTGFYVGAFAGYHFSRLTQEGCTGLCPTSSDGPSGALLGVQGGYDYQFSNNVVLGAFAAVPLLRPETTVHLGGGADFKVSPQFAATAAVRLGYAMDQWLPLHSPVSVMRISKRSRLLRARRLAMIISAI